jgi:hypothetical protein
MDIVNGTLARPESSGKEQDHWDHGNNEAFNVLLMCMSDKEVELIFSCETAADVWKKLDTLYQESMETLWQRYFGVMASPDKTPVNAMIEIQNYAAQLRRMGATIDEDFEIGRIISSLVDPKYRRIREEWIFVDADQQTTAFLLSRLKTWETSEAKKLVKSDETQKVDSGFNKGKPKANREEIAELKERTKCHLCKTKGHWARECPQKQDKKTLFY